MNNYYQFIREKKRHIDIDPYDEEIWEEHSVDDLIDDHLANFRLSIEWTYDCDNENVIEELVKDYRELRLKKNDENYDKFYDDFYNKWKDNFKWQDLIFGGFHYPLKDDIIKLKIDFTFEDGSRVYMYFNPITLNHFGGLRIGARWHGDSYAVRLYELMEPDPDTRIRTHPYDFEFFKNKLGIELDV